MLRRLPLILLVNLVFGGTVPVYAEINRWVDESGQVHYDDQPKGQATRHFNTTSRVPIAEGMQMRW